MSTTDQTYTTTSSVSTRTPAFRSATESDRVLGVLIVRDLWIAQREASTQGPIELCPLLRQPLFVPERSPALDVLEQFQATGTHVAIIIDERGGHRSTRREFMARRWSVVARRVLCRHRR